MEMKSILSKHQSNIALVIGNGINLYAAAGATNSGNDILLKLAQKHISSSASTVVPDGVTLTEFYDVLDLNSRKQNGSATRQQEFFDQMASWKAYDHHKRILEWAMKSDNPNFYY